MERYRKVIGFAAVSATGLAIDFALFILLLTVDFSLYTANAMASTCAVAFVYFASIRQIFSYRGRFLVGLFAAYLVYQMLGITLGTLAVGYLAQHLLPAVVAKIAILPVTFSANYLFMSFLTRKGQALPDTVAEERR